MATKIDLANWMQNLPVHLHSIPVKQLALPGSHDSGAFYLDKNSNIAPGEGKTIKFLAKVFGKYVKNIIYKWSITQDLSFSQQLQNGIRYLDLRVAYVPKTNDFNVVHGLYGSSYTAVFEEINYFLDSHPKEIVLLDFNHLFNFTKDAQVLFVSQIMKSFGKKLYGPGKLGTESSINDIWSKSQQVIALYADSDMVKENLLLWSQAHIYSPWFNTPKVDTLIKDLDKRFDDLKEESYNVFQAILTPATSTIVLHWIKGSLKTTLAESCDELVCSWLQKIADKKKKGVNIVMCDFIGFRTMVEKTIGLNYIA